MDIDWDGLQKFGDFAEPPRQLDGDKMKIEDILNRTIAVTGYRIDMSKIKEGQECLTMQFILEGQSEPKVLFTGSKVLADQVRRYESHIPFITKVGKVGKYYCMQ